MRKFQVSCRGRGGELELSNLEPVSNVSNYFSEKATISAHLGLAKYGLA